VERTHSINNSTANDEGKHKVDMPQEKGGKEKRSKIAHINGKREK
jgi:hypothetical protein